MRGDERLVVDVRVDAGGAARAAPRPRLELAIDVGPGITAVRGPSGAGKSTLLSVVAGLLRPARGHVQLGAHVLFDGTRGIWVPPHRRRVALVQQSLALFPHLSALDNVAYGVPAAPRAERRARAAQWLARARVPELAARMPETLSGGEAQRVALARALASEPRALLLDEPFSALDAPLRRALAQELRALVDELNVPTLFVTHDDDEARTLTERFVVIDGGVVRAQQQGAAP